MSTDAIRQVIHELEGLPESDQQLILRFLSALKSQRTSANAPATDNGRNPSLQVKNGLLVFTGTVGAPDTDWLQVVRDERDDELLRLAAGDPTPR